MNPTTTLARVRALHPCADGWATGLKRLGPALDAPISLGDIATSNGAIDAFWCIRAFLDWGDMAVRRAVIAGAVMPAVERASAHTQDSRVHDAIQMLRSWCDGDDVDLLGARKLAASAYADAAAPAYAYAAAADAENAHQRADLIAAFPPVRLAP